ncbi:uncharacterized protein PpBr36_10205 [Pyricularia pennisetigena]|uniref:uncharacterized protein n=1 Tax=Pyricularia pennisetigena TaxID=1578925 RepID=UPI00114EA8C4|nr:uncharacterized protein PpBr36_10205 [Pyricularia pennisetigena]TLS21368.1 hypothetical protein PpBr36_10205 [Pyricularia pennisetigena]
MSAHGGSPQSAAPTMEQPAWQPEMANGEPYSRAVHVINVGRARFAATEKYHAQTVGQHLEHAQQRGWDGEATREVRESSSRVNSDERKIDRIEERLSAIEGLLRARLPGNGFQGPPASSSSSSGPGAMSQQIPMRPATGASSCAGTSSAGNAPLKSGHAASDSHCSSPLDFDSPATYEGGSSLTAQSTLAGEFFEKAVLLGRTPGFYGDGGDDEINARMRDALASLKQMVAMQKETASADELTPGCCGGHPEEGKVGGEDGALQKLEMPPMQAVLAILRRVKESGSRVFEDDMAFLDMDEFIALCKNVYFATEEFSEATFIIVNAGLYHMFASEFDATNDEALRQQYCAYEDQLQSNLDAAFLRLPLCLPATMMNIKALLIGTMHTIGYVCKPKLAWTLITTAARMVLTLGFHRIDNSPAGMGVAATAAPATTASATTGAAATATPGSISAGTSPAAAAAAAAAGTATSSASGKTNVKVLIFWYVYTIEKALALRLGYSSVIRDHDITIPYTLDTSVQPGPFSGLVNAWVKLAVIQSRSYEQLYSPQALSQPREVTVSCARELGRQLEAVMDEAKRARDALAEAVGPDSKYTGSLDMQLKGDEIICYTTLTLIYRAVPAADGSADTFAAECVEAARRVLEIHQECMAATANNMHLQVSQIHWSILLTPFAPFFVLFCQTISTSSSADLALIQGFAASLIPASEYSEPVKRLQRLCDVFCKVAAVYLEAKARANQVGDRDMMQIGNEFDMYFGALGLMQHQQQHQPMVEPQWNAQHHHHHQQQQQQQQQQQHQHQHQQQFAAVQQHHQHHPQHAQPDVQNLGMMMPGFDMGLGDWYAGNRNIMGLLEGDMSTFGMSPDVEHGHGHGHVHGHMG